MTLIKVGKHNVTVDVNGTTRINDTIVDDASYSLSESLGTDILVNGTQEASYTQSSDSNYDVSVGTDTVYIFHSGATGEDNTTTSHEWGVTVNDANGNTIYDNTFYGLGSGNVEIDSGRAVNPAGDPADWTSSVNSFQMNGSWSYKKASAGVSVNSVTKS